MAKQNPSRISSVEQGLYERINIGKGASVYRNANGLLIASIYDKDILELDRTRLRLTLRADADLRSAVALMNRVLRELGLNAKASSSKNRLTAWVNGLFYSERSGIIEAPISL